MKLQLPSGEDVLLFLPENKGNYPLFYLILPPEDARNVWALSRDSGLILAVPPCGDWNRDLTPWPARGVHRNGGEFTGGADGYLETLLSGVLPETERQLRLLGYEAAQSGIAGYSLGGMFALYALTRTDRFQLAASVSGSLWYDGFRAYLQTNPLRSPARCALSLGRGETHARNHRMKSVAEDTAAIVEALRPQCKAVSFQWTEGGHFTDVPKRMAELLVSLASPHTGALPRKKG